jgi:PTS system mannose-specific IIA component
VKIGVVIVTHYRLGDEFLQALKKIVPETPPFLSVAIDPDQTVDKMRGMIADAIKNAEQGEGVLVLTDMFGGTPSNISLSFLEEHSVAVVTGMNLPMLIKLSTLRKELPLAELATFIKDYGRRNISVASEILPDEEK